MWYVFLAPSVCATRFTPSHLPCSDYFHAISRAVGLQICLTQLTFPLHALKAFPGARGEGSRRLLVSAVIFNICSSSDTRRKGSYGSGSVAHLCSVQWSSCIASAACSAGCAYTQTQVKSEQNPPGRGGGGGARRRSTPCRRGYFRKWRVE
jgi:hypothetical protein